MHRPADDPSGIEIDHDRHIEPSLAGRDEGDVGDPDAIGRGRRKVAVEEVRCWRFAVACGVGLLKAPSPFGLDTVQGSQPSHALEPARDAFGAQGVECLHRPVVLTGLGMDAANVLEQLGIRAGAPTGGTRLRGVVATARETKGPTQGGDGIRRLVLGNKLVLHADCFAK